MLVQVSWATQVYAEHCATRSVFVEMPTSVEEASCVLRFAESVSEVTTSRHDFRTKHGFKYRRFSTLLFHLSPWTCPIYRYDFLKSRWDFQIKVDVPTTTPHTALHAPFNCPRDLYQPDGKTRELPLSSGGRFERLASTVCHHIEISKSDEDFWITLYCSFTISLRQQCRRSATIVPGGNRHHDCNPENCFFFLGD